MRRLLAALCAALLLALTACTPRGLRQRFFLQHRQ